MRRGIKMIKMFTQKEFEVFEVVGLDPRMAAIREQIQPIFQELDAYFVAQLAPDLETTLPVHIAQHRRRTANAPDFTWSAMGGNKRGYKKFPHFTLGINGQYLVMWLSFIDNPQNEQAMAQALLDQPALFKDLATDMVLNTDHTLNNYHELTKEQLEVDLTRWRDVKKGEFQIGRIIQADDIKLQDPEVARAYMLETYRQLLPLYQATYPICLTE